MGNDAVQPAFEVRAKRVHANSRIALEFTVFVFFTASHSVLAEQVAEDSSRDIAHEMLAVHGDRVIALVVHDRDGIVHRIKELFVSLLDRRPSRKFLLHDRTHELEERF